jgi:CRP/FNR family transcriptional regulator, cyclic AMP receptor protein
MQAARRCRHRPREVILREGDRDRALHIIMSGYVLVSRTLRTGQTVGICVLGRGQVIGELGCLTGAARIATVTAVGTVDTMRLAVDDAHAMRRAYPVIDEYFLFAMQRSIDGLTGRVATDALPSVAGRTRERLIEHEGTFGGPTGPVTIPLTQDELAAFAATTRPRITECLADLERRGIVCRGRGTVRILDRDALGRTVG